MDVVIRTSQLERLQAELLSQAAESCAVLYANAVRRGDGLVRLLVREIDFPSGSDYTYRSPIAAELDPTFVARVGKTARIGEWSVIFVHSHPGSEAPRFS